MKVYPYTSPPCKKHTRGNRGGGASGDLQRERWKRLRRIKLSENALCELCLMDGRTTEAVEVDHIVPRLLRRDLTFVMSNLQSVCRPCHVVKTAKENSAMNGEGVVVVAKRKWCVDLNVVGDDEEADY